jgi:hypothetical protein
MQRFEQIFFEQFFFEQIFLEQISRRTFAGNSSSLEASKQWNWKNETENFDQLLIRSAGYLPT